MVLKAVQTSDVTPVAAEFCRNRSDAGAVGIVADSHRHRICPSTYVNLLGVGGNFKLTPAKRYDLDLDSSTVDDALEQISFGIGSILKSLQSAGGWTESVD